MIELRKELIWYKLKKMSLFFLWNELKKYHYFFCMNKLCFIFCIWNEIKWYKLYHQIMYLIFWQFSVSIHYDFFLNELMWYEQKKISLFIFCINKLCTEEKKQNCEKIKLKKRKRKKNIVLLFLKVRRETILNLYNNENS